MLRKKPIKSVKRKSKVSNPSESENSHFRLKYSKYLITLVNDFNDKASKNYKYLTKKEKELELEASILISELITSLRPRQF